MAYDKILADRIRTILAGTPGLTEKKMFGGHVFLVNGHIAASAYQDGRLLITCRKETFEELLAEPGAGPMLRGGKPMSGWVLVDAEVATDDETLAVWVGRGLSHARTRPPK